VIEVDRRVTSTALPCPAAEDHSTASNDRRSDDWCRRKRQSRRRSDVSLVVIEPPQPLLNSRLSSPHPAADARSDVFLRW